MNTDSSSQSLEPGQKLAGVYLLQKPLDVGGAAVWLAQDEVLGKAVALHFLPPAVASDARALVEIRQEVKRVRPLIHPNILRVYDLVEGPGWAAIATEVFNGRRLSAELEAEGNFQISDVQDWMDEVCAALEEAHRIKITHRDLAPENLFINFEGALLIANFGIGRVVQSSLQRSGELGSSSARWSSASPQLLDTGLATPSDDVYGIGSLFFHLLTGVPVFSGGDVFTKIRESVPARVSEVRFEAAAEGEPIPAGWDNVIAACLNKARDERPARPSEIVAAIEAYAPAEAAPEKPTSAAVAAILSPEALGQRSDSAAAAPLEPAPETTAPPASEAAVLAPAETEPVLSLVREPEPAPDVATSVASASDEARPTSHEPAAEEPVEISASDLHAGDSTSAEEPSTGEVPEASSPTEAPLVAKESVTPESQASHREGGKSSSSPARRPPVEPRRLYDTDEDAFSSILPKRFRFPLAVAAAVVVVLLLINGAFNREKDRGISAAPVIATNDAADTSELTPVNNLARPSEAESIEAPAKGTVPEAPAAVNKPTPAPELLVAAAPPAAALPAGQGAAPSPGGPLGEKAAALERLKADLAETEKQQQMKLQEKQAAEAALAEAQKAIDAKAKAAEAIRKEAKDLITARQQREEAQKAADLAAQAAQQLAAEKAQAAEAARKALAEFEEKNREKLAAPDRVQTELQSLQQAVEAQRKIAEESGRAAAAAAAAREQQVAAIRQAEQEVAAAQSMAAKAAEEAERKNAVASERRKLDEEIAAMRALFEQKMKDIEDRRRQLESGPAPAAVAPPASPAAAPAPPASTPAPPTPRTAALATPAPTLPLMAARTEPAPAPPAPAAAIPAAPVPAGGSANSLGMRFAPVGDVQFSVWLTRWKDFDTFARAVNLKSTAWRGPGFRQGPDHPVVNVTWNEAMAFCKWLTDKEQKEGVLPANQFYRLPYDLEWSKAVGLPGETGKTPEARDMGVPDVYPWGTDWPPPKGAGNYTGEETGSDVAIKGYDDGFAWTSPVGSFPPNKLGIYDMGGNVWQWCMDSWNADSKARVLRGASWYNGALKLSLLASCRIHASPDSSTDNYGFRIVKSYEAAPAKPVRR